jgi:translocation and assembly module TamB
VLGTLVSLVLAIGVLLAAGAWLLRTDDGLQWLVERVPGLTVDGLYGRPDGGPMEAARVQWQSGGMRLVIDGLSWRDARWHWRPHPGAWIGVALDAPRARRVEFTSAPAAQPGPGAPRPPADLALPLQLTLRGLEIAALHVNALPFITDVRADAQLGADDGRAHELTHLSFTMPQVQASGQARIGTSAPMALQAQARVASPPGSARAWQAQADVAGTLARPEVDATLLADGGARLDVRATLAPFAAWPLSALDASTRDLDLATLAAGLPATRLSGRAEVHSSGMDTPARVLLTLDNALPGRWREARLPVRSLRAELSGRPDERDRIDLTQVDLQLGGTRPAGRVTGNGRWQGDRVELALAAEGVQPAMLDARLAAMTLNGPLTMDVRGLPSPGAAGGTRELDGTLETTLTGRVAAAPRGTPAVRLHARAEAMLRPDALRVTLHRLDVAAGDATARASATLLRDPSAKGPWRLDGRGELARFDPSVWFPGAADTWGRGPHALNATWDAALSWPAAAPAGALLLRTVGGHARVALRPSRLAGIALEGEAALQGGASGTTVSTELRADANRLRLNGLASRSGDSDRWQADVDAPTIATFAPLAALVPAAAAWLPKAGALTGRAVVEGRWPALRTEGELRASGVQAGAAQLQRLDARWSVTGTQLDAPLSLSVDAQGLALGMQRVERLAATLAGSLASHRLELTASTPLRPPAWADTLAADASAADAPGTALQLAAQGRLARSAQGQAWDGTLQQVRIAPRRDNAAPWIAARDLSLQVQTDAQGRLLDAGAAPGRMEVLGATLRWTQARWSAAGSSRIALDAQLEPLRIAPWLARLQPSFGWGGDLALGGRFIVTDGARFDADVVLERAGGDLTVTDEAGTQALGLTDLRLALAAHDGTWHFTQALAGSNVGVLGGAQSLRVAPGAAWPAPDTPLEGVVELRVANLGVWAPWLPPGWRLGGQLRTSASLGGRFGAPEYTGEVVGSGLSVRHLLQGVDVRDGDLAVTLRGADAKVERFTLKGGDGELRLAGGASFGATPRAQLQLQANRFRVLGRVDRRIVVSGKADLSLQAERLTLDGRVAVDEGLIDVTRADAPALDGDVVVVRGTATNPARPSPVAADPGTARIAVLRNAAVSLVVELGDKLRLRGRGLDTTLAGDLFITAPGGKLAVEGTVRAEQGTFEAYGEKLTIERGSLTFTGAVENPRLDILAVRSDLDVRVGVAVAGGVVNPRVRLYSEPEMGELDKLSWLVMGRAPEGLGRTDTALLQRAALALLSGPGSGGGPRDTLLKNIGLDELSVRQNDDGSVRDTIVTLGKQISQRWYVGYERGVNDTTGTWQLIYRVARRLTMRAEAGADNALDVIWTWRWN